MYRAPPAFAPLVVVGINENLIALERTTGRRAWQATLKGASFRRLAITPERVVAIDVTPSPTRLVCLAYETGARLWMAETRLTDALVIDGEQVFVAGNGELACHALDDGRLLWHDAFKGMGLGEVAFGTPGNVNRQV